MNIWLEIPWEKRIKRAINDKKFTSVDIRSSRLWINDPISELSDIIQFKNNQISFGPVDIQLIMDGIYFSKAVEEDDVGLALSCMKSINSRVLKLYNIEPWKSINGLKYKVNQ